jgi:hypothetical protein
VGGPCHPAAGIRAGAVKACHAAGRPSAPSHARATFCASASTRAGPPLWEPPVFIDLGDEKYAAMAQTLVSKGLLYFYLSFFRFSPYVNFFFININSYRKIICIGLLGLPPAQTDK